MNGAKSSTSSASAALAKGGQNDRRATLRKLISQLSEGIMRLSSKQWSGRWRSIRLGVLALSTLAITAVGLREVVNSSTFQLFGDYVARIETPDKIVALTFDDGPHPVYTARVLDVLDRYQIQATFFMMGRNVERYPAVARQVLDRGHEIGNHSYSHPKLIFMSPQRVREEIERTDQLLRNIGVTGEIYFRPPHASKFLVLPYVLTKMHKLSVLGDVDPEEWKQRPAAVMTASILRQVRPGSIIGLHDPAGAETVRTLEDSVEALRARGYRFETVSQLLRRQSGT
jgi:peptidoglycan/xylan/chitin deacetylase (PgdA/CDA1 family)